MPNSLIDIIQFLSITLMAVISYILKMMWTDIKSMRNDLTILQTEHRLMIDCHHNRRQSDNE